MLQSPVPQPNCRAVLDSTPQPGDEPTPLTYFEFGTLAALALFAQASLDVLILEVGLGGRLDAVNIFDADVAVVTTIDVDHVEYLGPTREAIGREKAGIFRSGTPAICGDPDPPRSLVLHASTIGARLWRLGPGKEGDAEQNDDTELPREPALVGHASGDEEPLTCGPRPAFHRFNECSTCHPISRAMPSALPFTTNAYPPLPTDSAVGDFDVGNEQHHGTPDERRAAWLTFIVVGGGPTGTELPEDLVVRVLDQSGNPVIGQPVSWVIGTGGGTPNPGISNTDDNGLARTRWTLGGSPGNNTLNAVVSVIGNVTFTATATGTPRPSPKPRRHPTPKPYPSPPSRPTPRRSGSPRSTAGCGRSW